MKNKTGNIVVYLLSGAIAQPVGSADAADVYAGVKVQSILTTHSQDCAKRGVPFAAKVVSEFRKANADGVVTRSEFVELHPQTGEEIGETYATLAELLNPPAVVAPVVAANVEVK